MGAVGQSFVFFLTELALGLFAMLILVHPKWTGVGFQRVLLYISAGLLVLGMVFTGVSQGFQLAEHYPHFVLLMGLSLMFVLLSEKKTTLGIIVFGSLVLGSFIFQLSQFTGVMQLGHLLTTMFLGITVYSMCLGHYYLVVPKLSEKHLLKTFYLFWPVLGLKIFLSAYYLWQSPELLETGSRLGEGYLMNWVFLSIRYVWGYLALFVLSIFGYRLTKMNSIQSATGVLYVMVFFILPGEIISLYYSIQHGIFL